MNHVELANRVKFWADAFETCPQMTQREANNTEISGEYLSGVDFAAELIKRLYPDLGQSIKANELRQTFKQYGYEEGDASQVFSRSFIKEILARFDSVISQLNYGPPSFQSISFDIDIAAIIYETCGITISEKISLGALRSDTISQYATIYASVRTVERLDAASFQRNATQVAENQINKIDAEMDDRLNSLTKKIKIQSEVAKNGFTQGIQDETKAVFSAIADEKAALLAKFETDAEKRLTLKIDALTTNLILSDSIDMWRDKAREHKFSFWLASVVFAAMILIPLNYGLTHSDQIKSMIETFLPNSEKIPFGRLVILTAPLLGYAWLLRLVSRYLNQNLTLGQDADLRRVMARTFVQLVAEGAAKDDQDRATILTALFRPMPGTSTEDDQPPNVIGMIKKEISPSSEK